MSDNRISEAEQQYLQDLEEAQNAGLSISGRRDDEPPKPAETPVEAQAEQVAQAQAETPAQAPVPAEAAPAAPAELFPGFNALSAETQAVIRKQFDDAAEIKRKAEEQDREFKRLQGKVNSLSPIQSQFDKQKVELTRLQQELQKAKGNPAQTAAAKQKLDQFKQQFPDEAAMVEEYVGPLSGQIAELQRQLTEEREQRKQDQQRSFVNEQISTLAKAYPDWESRRVFVQQDGSVVPGAAGELSQTMATWLNAMEPYEKNRLLPLIYSSKAEDAIYLNNQFERDRLWAATLKETSAAENGLSTAHTQAAPAARPAPPEADPDPTRKSSPPASTAARIESSDAESTYAAALREYGHLLSRNPNETRRRAS